MVVRCFGQGAGVAYPGGRAAKASRPGTLNLACLNEPAQAPHTSVGKHTHAV